MVLKMSAMKYVPLMAFQVVLMVLYFIFVKYNNKPVVPVYGFEGTHVMIFIGFGFLMTFLKKYSYSALGFNWLLAALVIQWALLCQSFYHMDNENNIYITKKSLLEADIMAATVLITFGVLLGYVNGVQLLFIAIIETVIACLNLWLITDKFEALDVGGSIAIHTFGAYFGLGASLALRAKPNTDPANSNNSPAVDLNGPSYVSDVTAMIGSIFLWVYWPSFNSGLTNTPKENEMAVVNTYLSLAAATVTTFVFSSVLSKHDGRFDMVHIQNSTLAGGVAVGAVCNLEIGPGGAVAIGMGGGLISVLGYRYLTPLLTKLGVRDTCGVHNLHGMPGVYSGLLAIIFATVLAKDPVNVDEVVDGVHVQVQTQSSDVLSQFLALLVTLILALVSGFLTGLLTRLPFFGSLKEDERYNDEVNWELP